MTRLGVLQLVDTLEPGGAERVALNLANSLPVDRYRSFLATTRRDGPLAAQVGPHAGRLRLDRRSRMDLAALRRLARFVRENSIDIVHAHGTALFAAAGAASLGGTWRLLWHDHFGRHESERRSVWPFRLVRRRIDGVVSVTRSLASWSEDELGIAKDRVWYVPNFVETAQDRASAIDLPGRPGKRVVAVARLRPQKDHRTMLRALARVRDEEPEVHLSIVGGPLEGAYYQELLGEIEALRLSQSVTLLGDRTDVAAILASANLGVLSSASEGLPLALLEYGAAGLPSVATDVGECAAVLENGAAGVVVPPGDPEALATALLRLLQSAEERERLGRALRARTAETYSPQAAMRSIVDIYSYLLEPDSR